MGEGQAGPSREARRLEDLGDAEVQELGDAGFGHQDVVGLEVAVHHQVLVSKVDRGAHLAEQLHALAYRQPPAVAVGGQGFALDVVHDQVGQAFAGGPAVQ